MTCAHQVPPGGGRSISGQSAAERWSSIGCPDENAPIQFTWSKDAVHNEPNGFLHSPTIRPRLFEVGHERSIAELGSVATAHPQMGEPQRGTNSAGGYASYSSDWMTAPHSRQSLDLFRREPPAQAIALPIRIIEVPNHHQPRLDIAPLDEKPDGSGDRRDPAQHLAGLFVDMGALLADDPPTMFYPAHR
jgi:hypothetical protein